MTLRLISVCAVILSIGLILHSPAEAKESKEVCHSSQVSHDAWKALLNRYVKQGSVDYRRWHKAEADRRSLKSYIEKLSGYCKPAFKGLSKKAQLASLINLYNAAVIDLVLRHYPISSINDIGKENIFERPILSLQWFSEPLVSLNTLENNIIRSQFAEPRIHFALVCAAGSCPVLLNEPYEAGRVLEQLEEQTRRFLGDSSQVTYSKKQNAVLVSKIFDWFRADFEKNAGSLNAYLYRELRKNNLLPDKVNPTVNFREYSWKLNQAP